MYNRRSRWWFPQGIDGVIIGGLLRYGVCESAAAQLREAWPQFGYNQKSTGYTPDHTGPVANIKQQLNFATGT